MSAADAREALEAEVWKAVTWAIRNADEPSSNALDRHVKAVLAKADAYARAGIDDDPSPRLTRRRERMEALAEMRVHDTTDPEPPAGTVTVGRAAELLGVSERTVLRYRRELERRAS